MAPVNEIRASSWITITYFYTRWGKVLFSFFSYIVYIFLVSWSSLKGGKFLLIQTLTMIKKAIYPDIIRLFI